jgi:hypothetical protein
VTGVVRAGFGNLLEDQGGHRHYRACKPPSQAPSSGRLHQASPNSMPPSMTISTRTTLTPRPFVGTKSADVIPARTAHARAALDLAKAGNQAKGSGTLSIWN